MKKGEIKAYAKNLGVDIFKVANIERFKGLPPEKHPSSIFPETKSVIIVSRRITRGTLRGVEEGTNFLNYGAFGYDWLDNRFIALTTFRVSEYLENKGWEAVPLPNLPPEIPPLGVAVKKGSPEPNVMLDFDDAAVRAGAGEIGYCGVLLTPEFGPRQRIQIILTDANIEPDPILQKNICLRDSGCKGICPLGALTGEKKLNILGKEMKVAKIDFQKCAVCKNGAMPNRYHPLGKPDRLAAICIRSCVGLLEKEGRTAGRFSAPFRKRNPWKIKQETDFYKV